MQRQTEAENAAAEAEELQVQQQEWNMAELERMQEQQVMSHTLCAYANYYHAVAVLSLNACKSSR